MNKKTLFAWTPILLASCVLATSCSVMSSSRSDEVSKTEPSSSLEPSDSSSFVPLDTSSIEGTEAMQDGPSSVSSLTSLEDGSIDFFDHHKDVSIKLEMSDDVMTFISTYQSTRGIYAEAYLPGKLTITFDHVDYVFEEVGIRQKGNTSRSSFFSDGSIHNPVHFKISLKATFDDELYDNEPLQRYKKEWIGANDRKERKNRNFAGYEKLDFKYVPRNNFACHSREVVAYDAFERCGLYAPKARLCSFAFGNENSLYRSDYEIIENIDKEFIKKRLGKNLASGDLYKCVYNGMGRADFSRNGAVERDVQEGNNVGERIPFGKIGVENDFEQYQPCYQLKTNDDSGEGSDFSKMSNFINVLWNCVYGNGTKQELENTIDMEQFLKFSAVSYLLGNPDDQRYNNNNFYIYFMPDTGKAIFLPYDWDWCLGADWTGTDRMERLTPLDPWTCEGDGPNNLFKATFLGNGLSYDISDYQNEYLGYIDECVDVAFSYDSLLSLSSALGSDENEIDSIHSYMNNKMQAISY